MIKARKAEIKASVREIKRVMATHGISIADLGKQTPKPRSATGARNNSSKKPGSGRSVVKPKYRNPNNKKETWSGRGRTPLWVRDYLKNGKKIEDLAIKS